MNTDRNSESTIPPDATDIGSEFQNALGSMDGQATQHLRTLQWVHQSRLSQLSRALVDAKAQYPPDSPEVQSAEAAVAATSQTVGQISLTHQQRNTPDPEVATQGWALHGRVFDDQWKPLSGHTVFLVDAQKAYRSEFGFSYTDDTGYFLINYPGPQPTPKRPAEKEDQTESQSFLAIVDTQAQPVYLAETAFVPVIGAAVYQTIILTAGERPIGDPPKEIREIAFPKQKRKKSPSGRKSIRPTDR